VLAGARRASPSAPRGRTGPLTPHPGHRIETCASSRRARSWPAGWHATPRRTGETVPAGSTTLSLFGAANRDPGPYGNPASSRSTGAIVTSRTARAELLPRFVRRSGWDRHGTPADRKSGATRGPCRARQTAQPMARKGYRLQHRSVSPDLDRAGLGGVADGVAVMRRGDANPFHPEPRRIARVLPRTRSGCSDQTPVSRGALARATGSLTASAPQSVNSVI